MNPHTPEPHTAPGIAALLDEIGAAVIMTGLEDGVIRYVNAHVHKDLSMDEAGLVGRHYRDIFWPEFVPVFERLLAEILDGKEHTTIYYWAEKTLWEQVSMHLIHADGCSYALATITNISEIALTQYMADNAIYFDSLLRLPNGKKLEEDINALASVETVALVYFKIERMREINNLYGWDNGDNLLMQIRDWLLFSEPRRAQVYRLENGFAILGRGVTLEDGQDRARSIIHRFRQPWTLPVGSDNMQVYCSIKLGVVIGKYVKNEMRNLLIRTIESTRDSNKCTIYDETQDRMARRKIQVRDSLINSIHNGMKRFEVHYQPIVDIRTGRWSGAEALCRWNLPDGTPVPPDVFIHEAEQMRMVGEVDHWVRKTAMRECVALGLNEKDFLLNTNFSPSQEINPPFMISLHRALDASRFPPGKLNMEITESSQLTLDADTINNLKRITDAGILLSLDDFGTGYASLEYLINLPADFLKVDKMFIDDVDKDSYRRYLLKMIVDLSKYLDMRLVAEGVETEAQLRVLRELEVDYGQGYYFSRPLSYAQLEENVGQFG